MSKSRLFGALLAATALTAPAYATGEPGANTPVAPTEIVKPAESVGTASCDPTADIACPDGDSAELDLIDVIVPQGKGAKDETDG